MGLLGLRFPVSTRLECLTNQRRSQKLCHMTSLTSGTPMAVPDAVPVAPAGTALLMILGFYLLDGPASVWQEAIVATLQRLGYSGDAARQAVARAAHQGILARERHGRRACLSLTPAGTDLLR